MGIRKPRATLDAQLPSIKIFKSMLQALHDLAAQTGRNVQQQMRVSLQLGIEVEQEGDVGSMLQAKIDKAVKKLLAGTIESIVQAEVRRQSPKLDKKWAKSALDVS